jgi:hypothetical protein
MKKLIYFLQMSDEMNPIKNYEDNEKDQKQNSNNTKRRFFFAKRTGGNQLTNSNAQSDEHLEKQNEESIGKEETCAHEIIIKDMCGNCGKDLRM